MLDLSGILTEWMLLHWQAQADATGAMPQISGTLGTWGAERRDKKAHQHKWTVSTLLTSISSIWYLCLSFWLFQTPNKQHVQNFRCFLRLGTDFRFLLIFCLLLLVCRARCPLAQHQLAAPVGATPRRLFPVPRPGPQENTKMPLLEIEPKQLGINMQQKWTQGARKATINNGGLRKPRFNTKSLGSVIWHSKEVENVATLHQVVQPFATLWRARHPDARIRYFHTLMYTGTLTLNT